MALNYEQLVAEIYGIATAHRSSNSGSGESARAIWAALCANPEQVNTLMGRPAPYMLPAPVTGDWSGSLSPISVMPVLHPYRVGSVDGSQVYPDHHEGVPFFLVHTATVCFTYGVIGAESGFTSRSNATVYSLHDFNGSSHASPAALVDRIRTEHELRAGRDLAQDSFPVLLDGSLIFWHLAVRAIERDPFFRAYCSILLECAHRELITVWYTSQPQGRDLVNLVRVASGETSTDLYKTITDADILAGWLEPGYRTALFFSGAEIAAYYPEQVRPVFFYINTGDEIARVEIPAWMAHKPELCDYISGVLLDQCTKGQGYPICLAEAHEHAVVRSADRELFFVTARKAVQETGGQGVGTISHKLLNKRRAGF